MPSAFVMFAQIMDLGMAVVARGDAVGSPGFLDLFGFQAAIMPSGFRITGLEKPAAAAAAVIVRFVGGHVDEVFFADNRFHHKAQIVGNGIAEAFSNELAGILNRELDLEVLVPVGVDLQLAFPDPLRIVLDDALDFEIVGNFEFFQSGPDCE